MAVIEAIATTYLEADAASVEFSGIPATYEHLQLRFSARSTDGSGTYTSVNLQFGTGGGAVDTGTNYARHYMYGNNTTETGGGNTGINQIWMGAIDNADANAAQYAAQLVDILDYASAVKNTTVQGVNGTLGSPEVRFNSGLWDATGAVDRIKLAPYAGSFGRGSEFTLYGMKAAN